ncbi:MAG: hypothetical protein ACI9J3_003612 [Parvicellaceae bacterium]
MDLNLLNMMIPEFLLEFMFLSFIGISIIEGIFLNIGRRAHVLNWKGLVSAACLNLVSSIVGLFVGLFSRYEYELAIVLALLCSFASEAILLLWCRHATSNIKVAPRQILFLLIGNVISYILLWFTGPLMM